MFSKLLLIFILVPFIELVIILGVGKYIGIGYTILSIVVLSATGVIIAKKQGLNVLQKIKAELDQGRMPGEELLDGLLILVGSVLLITPGLLTDLLAFFFLLPVTRKIFKGFLRRKLESWIKSGKGVQFYFRKE